MFPLVAFSKCCPSQASQWYYYITAVFFYLVFGTEEKLIRPCGHAVSTTTSKII